MFLGNTNVYATIGESRKSRIEIASDEGSGRYKDQFFVFRHSPFKEAGIDGGPGNGLFFIAKEFAGFQIERTDAMPSSSIVLLRGFITFPFDGFHVQNDRTFDSPCLEQCFFEALFIMAIIRTEVAESQVIEHVERDQTAF